MQVRTLPPADVSRVGAIDRSEHVDVLYRVADGRLVAHAESIDVPPWDPRGSGPHSVASHVAFCAAAIGRGAVLLGALNGDTTAGLAVVDTAFQPGLAWLAFLHVSRPYRRRGAAQALWDAAAALARNAGANAVYVSANPTGAAVGFYLRQGCALADPVHPQLFAAEPDDVHLVCPLR